MPEQNPEPPPRPPNLPEIHNSPATPSRPDSALATVEPESTITSAAQEHDHTTTARRPSGCAWGIIGALGCLLVLLLPLLVAVLAGVTTLGTLLSSVEGIFSTAPPAARVTTTQTIVNSVQPLGQLVSVSAQLAKADIHVGIQQGALNSCGFSASHVAQGTIEGGIDLTRVDEEAIHYNPTTDTYTITLPSPQLTSCRIDFIRQYSRSFTACSVDWDEARLIANYIALSDFRDDAVESGLLSRAQQEIRVIVSNFVQALTGGNVVIIFPEAPENIPAPASCVPDMPEGWSRNEQTGEWLKR